MSAFALHVAVETKGSRIRPGLRGKWSTWIHHVVSNPMWRLALSAFGVHTYLHRADRGIRTLGHFLTTEVLYL